MANRDYLAEFAAKGGKVTRVSEGASNGMTAKDWYKAERGLATSTNELIEQRHVTSIDHMGRSVIVNGLGELIAVE